MIIVSALFMVAILIWLGILFFDFLYKNDLPPYRLKINKCLESRNLSRRPGVKSNVWGESVRSYEPAGHHLPDPEEKRLEQHDSSKNIDDFLQRLERDLKRLE